MEHFSNINNICGVWIIKGVYMEPWDIYHYTILITAVYNLDHQYGQK